MSPSIQTMGFFMSEINFCNTKEQLNHLGEVVTGKTNGSPTGADIDTSTLPYTGQVRKTLPVLEQEYLEAIRNAGGDPINGGVWASGQTFTSYNQYMVYNDVPYKPLTTTSLPYGPTGVAPDSGFVGPFESLSSEGAANIFSNKNLIGNSFFEDDGGIESAPDEIPRSYSSGDEIFLGFFAPYDLINVTYVNGKINGEKASGGTGELYVDVYKSEKQKELTSNYTSSVSRGDGLPINGKSSFVDNGDYWRITFEIDDTFSVKFEQGEIATRHDISSQYSNLINLSHVKQINERNPDIGTVCKTTSYYNGWAAMNSTVGGADRLIVLASEYDGTPDGYGDFYVDIAQTKVAKLIHNGRVNVYQFGAVGNNIRNDSQSIKAANMYQGVSFVDYGEGEFYCPDETVPFQSYVQYTGNAEKTFIRSDVDGRPVGASRSWLTADGPIGPAGRCNIKGISFRGELANTSQVGFILHDFYSRLESVYVYTCGGGGIKFDHKNQDGLPSSGSLVENYLDRCVVRNCGGILYSLGEQGNGKLTDGFMTDCIADGEDGDTTISLLVGQAAGWKIEGFHSYGSNSDTDVRLDATNNTRFTDFYIEVFERFAVDLPNCQGNVIVNGSIKGVGIDDTGGDVRYVTVGRAGFVSQINPDINISVDHQNKSIPASGVYFATDGIDGVVNVTKFNDANNKLTKLDGVDTGEASRPSEYGITDDKQTGICLHSGLAFPVCYNSGRLDGDSQAVDFKLPMVTSSGKMTGEVSIAASTFDNPGITASYKAMIYISGKSGSDTGIGVVDILSPSGFSINPEITLQNPGDVNPYLRVSYTLSNPNDKSVTTLIFVPVFASKQVQ